MITAKEAKELTKIGKVLNSIFEGIVESAKKGKSEFRVNAPLPETYLKYLVALGYEIQEFKTYYVIIW